MLSSCGTPQQPDTPGGHEVGKAPNGATTRRDFLKVTGAAVAMAPPLPEMLAPTTSPGVVSINPIMAGELSPQFKLFNLNVLWNAETLLGEQNPAYLTGADGRFLRCMNSLSDEEKAVLFNVNHPSNVKLRREMAESMHKNFQGGRHSLASCQKAIDDAATKLSTACRMPRKTHTNEHESKPPDSVAEHPPLLPDNPLALAIELCNIGVKWKPDSQRLILTRPSLDALFSDYRLAESPTGEIVAVEGMTVAEKHVARDALMRQFKELVQAHHPAARIASAGVKSIVIEAPPQEMLTALGLDPAVAHQRNGTVASRA